MIEPSSLLAFVAAALTLALIPGPGMPYVLAHTLHGSRRARTAGGPRQRVRAGPQPQTRRGRHTAVRGAAGRDRKLAEEIISDHELATNLWRTDNIDARLLAISLRAPKRLPRSELDATVRDPGFVQVADWSNAYVTRKHPEGLHVAVRARVDRGDGPEERVRRTQSCTL